MRKGTSESTGHAVHLPPCLRTSDRYTRSRKAKRNGRTTAVPTNLLRQRPSAPKPGVATCAPSGCFGGITYYRKYAIRRLLQPDTTTRARTYATRHRCHGRFHAVASRRANCAAWPRTWARILVHVFIMCFVRRGKFSAVLDSSRDGESVSYGGFGRQSVVLRARFLETASNTRCACMSSLTEDFFQTWGQKCACRRSRCEGKVACT